MSTQNRVMHKDFNNLALKVSDRVQQLYVPNIDAIQLHPARTYNIIALSPTRNVGLIVLHGGESRYGEQFEAGTHASVQLNRMVRVNAEPHKG